MSKSKILASVFSFYTYFTALTFAIMVLLGIILFATGTVSGPKLRHMFQALRTAPAEQEVQAQPDQEAFEALRNNEERLTYLRDMFADLGRQRSDLESRQASVLTRQEEQRSEIDRKKTELEALFASHKEKVETFNKEVETYAQVASSNGFKTNLEGYASLKGEELAELLLARQGPDTDIYIGKVLSALDSKPRAKFITAMMANERGGKERVNRILERIEVRR
mgnify:CR=1 FL=1